MTLGCHNMETKRHMQCLVGEPGFLLASCRSSDCRAWLPPASFSSFSHSTEWRSVGCGPRVGGAEQGSTSSRRAASWPRVHLGRTQQDASRWGSMCPRAEGRNVAKRHLSDTRHGPLVVGRVGSSSIMGLPPHLHATLPLPLLLLPAKG